MEFTYLVAGIGSILFFVGIILEAIFPTASPFFLFVFEFWRMAGISLYGCWLYEGLKESHERKQQDEEDSDEPFDDYQE